MQFVILDEGILSCTRSDYIFLNRYGNADLFSIFTNLFGTLAPPVYILYRITKYLFPKNEKDFELEAMKILQEREQSSNQK